MMISMSLLTWNSQNVSVAMLTLVYPARLSPGASLVPRLLVWICHLIDCVPYPYYAIVDVHLRVQQYTNLHA